MQKTVTKNEETTVTTSVGIARIPLEIQNPETIAAQVCDLIRGHWSIENSLHRTRDVIFNEDTSTIRSGHAPQTMAILKNIVTSLFQRGTVRSFPTAMRRFAANPEELFTFLGLTAVQKAHIYA
jgi:hypothetical protein